MSGLTIDHSDATVRLDKHRQALATFGRRIELPFILFTFIRFIRFP